MCQECPVSFWEDAAKVLHYHHVPFITTHYYQLLHLISWISSNFWKVFLFFASPAKDCHSTLDYTSKQAHWSSRMLVPSQPSVPLCGHCWRCMAGSLREEWESWSTTFHSMCRFHLLPWMVLILQRHCPRENKLLLHCTRLQQTAGRLTIFFPEKDDFVVL